MGNRYRYSIRVRIVLDAIPCCPVENSYKMRIILYNMLRDVTSISISLLCADGSTLRPELTGPSMAFLKSTVMFECKLLESPSPLTFEFIKGNDEVLATSDDPIKFPLKVNKGSEGKYFCRVTARNQTSTSNPVHLEVVSE